MAENLEKKEKKTTVSTLFFLWRCVFFNDLGQVVEEVLPEGLVTKWNASQPEALRVRQGDRIVAINGETLSGGALETLGEPVALETWSCWDGCVKQPTKDKIGKNMKKYETNEKRMMEKDGKILKVRMVMPLGLNITSFPG